MKLYCFYTPSHSIFYRDWFKPSASREFDVIPHEHPEQISESSEYAKIGWRETQYNKVLHWKKAVEDNMGDIIICSDVDIQFLDNCKTFLSNTLGNYDIGFQQNKKGGPICSGFFVCRCSLKTQNFFDIILKRLKKIMHEPGGGEQYEMQKLLSENWYSNQLDVIKLSHDKIWNPGKNYSKLKELEIPEDIKIHHANWTEGIESKIDQLEYVKSIHVQRNSPWQRTTISNLKLPKNKNSVPRIAFCTSSLLRDFDVSSYSIASRVINTLPCKPDFIGHFPTQSKTKNNKETLSLLKPLFENFYFKFEKDPPIEKSHKDMTENMSIQRHGAIGNLYQWLSMKSCAQMVERAEKKHGVRYDWVIWSRPDLHFFNSLENILNLDNKFIYFPAHDNHLHGLYDRFCMGNSDHMIERMNIYDYFTKKWYNETHNNKKLLTWNSYREAHIWNPELCLKHYIKKELKFKNKKLNICSGKLRERFFSRVPFWYSIYGTDRTGYKCEDDIVNHEVLNRLKLFTPYQVFKDSPWHAVNVLEDTVLWNHPQRIADFHGQLPIDSRLFLDNNKMRGGFLKNILKKLDEKTIKES